VLVLLLRLQRCCSGSCVAPSFKLKPCDYKSSNRGIESWWHQKSSSVFERVCSALMPLMHVRRLGRLMNSDAVSAKCLLVLELLYQTQM